MSESWSIYVIVLVVANIVAMVWLLLATAKAQPDDDKPAKTTGHKWDGVEELNTPLPRWWLYLFLGSVIFSVIYLALYPGLGNFPGLLNWTQEEQYQDQVEATRAKYADLYATYGEMQVEALIQNANAMRTAERLYANRCSTCHGSDARGAIGFPNLADNDWLYGGQPEQISHSITHGRSGMMPALGAVITNEDDLSSLVEYVHSLGLGERSDPSLQKGEKLYQTYCAACHGADGKGNQALGAPNLSDEIWLYGSDAQAIKTAITQGRNGKMPAHDEQLSKEEIHLLTAYVYSLSAKEIASETRSSESILQEKASPKIIAKQTMSEKMLLNEALSYSDL